MSYSLSISISLGQAYSGRTLAAQLYDAAGAAVGDEIATGFVEYGTQGEYVLTAVIPDDHQGALVVYESGNPEVCWACAINPREADAETPSVAGPYCAAEAQPASTGAAAGELFRAGATIGQDSHAGATAGLTSG
jgi:hypothetical protein